MTDKKDDNIIIGPWTGEPVDNNADWIKKKYDKALEKNNVQVKMQGKLDKIEILTEDVMIQLIHTLRENGYNLSDERFLLDIGFLSEVIKGTISRQESVPHVIQGLVDNLMTPDTTQNDDGMDVYYSKFNIPLLHELNDLAVEIKEETKTKLDIEFEPDTTLGSVSEWEKNKDEEDKDKD
tara:strand:- start:649 stop:1188 length:540 start_codon:yes stop_codon:yes gene_type:complete